MAERLVNSFATRLSADITIAATSCTVVTGVPAALVGQSARCVFYDVPGGNAELVLATFTTATSWTLQRAVEDSDRFPARAWTAVGTTIEAVLTAAGFDARVVQALALPLDVSQGGTGTTTFFPGNVLIGAGTLEVTTRDLFGGVNIWTAEQIIEGKHTVRQPLGVVGIDQVERTHDGSRVVDRNRDTGGFAWQGSAGTDLLKSGNDGRLTVGIAGDANRSVYVPAVALLGFAGGVTGLWTAGRADAPSGGNATLADDGSRTIFNHPTQIHFRINNVTQIIVEAGKTGFYGVPAVARPVLTYSRTGEPASTAAIRVALASLGLVNDQTVA